jgi:hypothetical protein
MKFCTRKDRIVNFIDLGPGFDPVMLPYAKSECDRWRNGMCVDIWEAPGRDRFHPY